MIWVQVTTSISGSIWLVIENYQLVQFDLCSAYFTKLYQLLEAIDWHTSLDPLNTLQTWYFFAKRFESCLKE